MCGRFTLTDENRDRVAAQLGVPVEQLIEKDYRPRWNIAPTDALDRAGGARGSGELAKLPSLTAVTENGGTFTVSGGAFGREMDQRGAWAISLG